MLHRTFTNRYEVKYLATHDQVTYLKGRLENLFSTDENTNGMDGYYNHSIYFDSPRYYFYREKQEGLLLRMKPRLRTHLQTLDSSPSQWFLELKGRYDKTVQKRRSLIDRSSADGLISGIFNHNYSNTDETMREFEYMWARLSLRPSVSVLYYREPFNSEFFPNVRITFDYRISGSLNFSLTGARSQHELLNSPTDVLVELKYTESIPRLIIDLFREAEMRQVTFSKYALCLESCVEKIPALS
jgi:hypothetical protein